MKDTVKKYVDGDETPTGSCIGADEKNETWKISCGENTVEWLISKNSKVVHNLLVICLKTITSLGKMPCQ